MCEPLTPPRAVVNQLIHRSSHINKKNSLIAHTQTPRSRDLLGFSLLLLVFLAGPVRVHEFVELLHQALLGGTTGSLRGFLEQDDVLTPGTRPLIPRVNAAINATRNAALFK